MISICTRCDLSITATNFVFGSGNLNSSILIIGEAPGYNEDKQGIPFVGKAGKYLREVLKTYGLSDDEFYITNVIKCRPPSNRTPSFIEIRKCLIYLLAQIKEMNPDMILLLGDTAMRTILNSPKSITQIRGNWIRIKNSRVMIMATYYPAYILRNDDKRALFEKDIETFVNTYNYKVKYTIKFKD